jgi:uncharacterized protein
MRTLYRSLPAPAALDIGVAGVPEGSDVELSLRLEAVSEGVLVSGSARARYVGECGRCLDAVEGDLDAELQELYVYPDSDAEDEEAARMVGDLIDLEPVLRDVVVLALPLRPLCREDCPGLCPDCGVRLADHPDHGHESVDPRWAALADLTGLTADKER